jgi:hypothetical protein
MSGCQVGIKKSADRSQRQLHFAVTSWGTRNTGWNVLGITIWGTRQGLCKHSTKIKNARTNPCIRNELIEYPEGLKHACSSPSVGLSSLPVSCDKQAIRRQVHCGGSAPTEPNNEGLLLGTLANLCPKGHKKRSVYSLYHGHNKIASASLDKR